MRSKKREPKIYTFAKRVFALTCLIFIVSSIYLNSYEMRLNASCKEKEDAITALKSDIDGLKMQKQKQVSFNNIKKIATKKGYNYEQSSVATTVVGVSESE